MDWFQFDGGKPSEKNDYTLATNKPTACGSIQEVICAIQAVKGLDDKPILDIDILSEMVDAQFFGENSDNVLLTERLVEQ